jgi:hypothetical protein
MIIACKMAKIIKMKMMKRNQKTSSNYLVKENLSKIHQNFKNRNAKR